MAYLAKIEGTYKYRVRTKVLWFWVVRPWKTEAFSWRQRFETPTVHLAYAPIKGVPISIALDADSTVAYFGIKIVGQEAWGTTLQVPEGQGTQFHFEPWKGVIVDGTVSYAKV